MQNITLPTDLVNAILQYMASRPYGEVFQLVGAIQAEAVKQAPDVEPSDRPFYRVCYCCAVGQCRISRYY